MYIEKKLIEAIEKWKYDDATVDLSIEELNHIDEVLKNDPVMADYCYRCAESGMWKFYDTIRDSAFKVVRISSLALAVGVSVKYISKFSHKLHLL